MISKDKVLTKELIIDNVLKKYQDLEIMVDVWTLGLIYKVEVVNNEVTLLMTFTSPMCPYGPMMVEEIKELVLKEGASKAEIEITFEPPWKPSDELRQLLGV